MLRSWPRPPARSRRISSETGCGISLLLSGKKIDITAATDGLDAFLLSIIRTEFAPQVAHMHVNAAVHGRHWPAQGSLREVLTADDFSRTAQERIQKIEFRPGKSDRFPVAGDAARVRVQINASQMHGLRSSGRSTARGAAQDRAQTGDQFAGI